MPKVPKLRQVREERLLSQEALAAAAAVSRATISHLETGQNARFLTIRKLAEALGVEPGDLR